MKQTRFIYISIGAMALLLGNICAIASIETGINNNEMPIVLVGILFLAVGIFIGGYAISMGLKIKE